MGLVVGGSDGLSIVGNANGVLVGLYVGEKEGKIVGFDEGMRVGLYEGSFEGVTVGEIDGDSVIGIVSVGGSVGINDKTVGE